jgi:TolB-like protein
VAARLSAFAFKGRAATAGDIARRLNVGKIVEGSLRREGTRIIIIARLVDGVTGYQLWSGRYESASDDVLTLEGDLADAAAHELQATLSEPQAAQLTLGGTHDAAAYDSYLRGMQAMRRGGAASLRQAIAQFDASVRQDPGFAMAYFQRANARESLSETDDSALVAAVRATQDAAEQDAARALALAPALGVAHVLMGRLRAENHLDVPGAEAELARGRALAPGDANAAMDAAMLQPYLGQMSQAVEGAEFAASLDPLTAQTQFELAEILFDARQYAAAAAALRHAAALQPAETQDAIALRAEIELVLRHPAATLQICREATDWRSRLLLAIAYRAQGQDAAASGQLTLLHATLGDTGAVQYAEVYAQWGQPDQAMTWLRKAEELRDPGLLSLRVDWMLDPLRAMSAFEALARRLGLPATANSP